MPISNTKVLCSEETLSKSLNPSTEPTGSDVLQSAVFVDGPTATLAVRPTQDFTPVINIALLLLNQGFERTHPIMIYG